MLEDFTSWEWILFYFCIGVVLLQAILGIRLVRKIRRG